MSKKADFSKVMITLLEDDHLSEPTSLVKPGDNPNADYLIPKLNLYAYVKKDELKDFSINGLLANKDIGGVRALFSRIPTNHPRYDEFMKDRKIIKISLSRLNRSSDEFGLFGAKFPKLKDKLVKLSKESLFKFTNSEDVLGRLYLNSKHEEFHDVPHIVIKVKERVPAYACTILKDQS